ncbi:hypothetical protein [Sphingobacterium faecium]|uniref:hypothetical protein n=1 Tax=Sphingobacterium faecium TaxID=34087 RepID=UPI00320B22F1
MNQLYSLKLRICVVFFLGLFLLTRKEAAAAAGKEDQPMFWTWLDYRPTSNFDSLCREMQYLGIDGVMLNAPTLMIIE